VGHNQQDIRRSAKTKIKTSPLILGPLIYLSIYLVLEDKGS